jgi:hypothetical protein
MMVFYMKYEPQINWANAFNNNLDISTGRSASELLVVPYFTSSSLLSRPCPYSTRRTLYDRENRTNSYDFLQIKRVHALLLSVSFKPIFVDFTLVIDMLALLQFSYAMVSAFIFYYFAHGTNTLNFFRVFLNTLNFFRVFDKHAEFFQSVWFEENSPSYFSPSITIIFLA